MFHDINFYITKIPRIPAIRPIAMLHVCFLLLHCCLKVVTLSCPIHIWGGANTFWVRSGYLYGNQINATQEVRSYVLFWIKSYRNQPFADRSSLKNTRNRIRTYNLWNINAWFLHKSGGIYNTYARNYISEANHLWM